MAVLRDASWGRFLIRRGGDSSEKQDDFSCCIFILFYISSFSIKNQSHATDGAKEADGLPQAGGGAQCRGQAQLRRHIPRFAFEAMLGILCLIPPHLRQAGVS